MNFKREEQVMLPAPTPPQGVPEFLTTAEVAQRYRTQPSTIRYWRHIGYLTVGTQYGRRLLFRSADLDAWDREREAQATLERGGAARSAASAL